MLKFERFEIRPETFTSEPWPGSPPGSNKLDVRQLFSGDLCVINALDQVDFNEDPMMVSICETCWIAPCAAPNSVHFRRTGAFGLMIPAFDLMCSFKDDHYEL